MAMNSTLHTAARPRVPDGRLAPRAAERAAGGRAVRAAGRARSRGPRGRVARAWRAAAAARHAARGGGDAPDDVELEAEDDADIVLLRRRDGAHDRVLPRRTRRRGRAVRDRTVRLPGRDLPHNDDESAYEDVGDEDDEDEDEDGEEMEEVLEMEAEMGSCRRGRRHDRPIDNEDPFLDGVYLVAKDLVEEQFDEDCELLHLASRSRSVARSTSAAAAGSAS